MEPLVIVSPHLDDAVLSCGQLMAGRPDCIVATICTGEPDGGTEVLTTFDRDSGHSSASAAMRARRGEDRMAALVLQAQVEHLGLLDNQYRDGHAFALPDAVEALENLLDESGAQLVLSPVGLAHPDHVQAAVACAELAERRQGIELWLYEELPMRVLQPELVPARLDWWRSYGYDLVLGFLGTGPLEAKAGAVSCYESQLWALRTVCGGSLAPVKVPERMWRAWRR